MKINYKLIDSVSQLPLDRFQVEPDASIFESWEFLRLGDGANARYFSRAKPGNPQLMGKQLRIETNLLDWQNQDHSKTYVAVAHQLDFTRQTEYVGHLSRFDVKIPEELYQFDADADTDPTWDGVLRCGLPDDTAVTVEICHVQGQELNATASVKSGWQGKFYVMVRILVDRSMMETLTADINSGQYRRLTTTVLVTPWRLIGETFDNLLLTERESMSSEDYIFPLIDETRCNDMFRFTLEPVEEPVKPIQLLQEHSYKLQHVIDVMRSFRPLMIVQVIILGLIALMVSQD